MPDRVGVINITKANLHTGEQQNYLKERLEKIKKGEKYFSPGEGEGHNAQLRKASWIITL